MLEMHFATWVEVRSQQDLTRHRHDCNTHSHILAETCTLKNQSYIHKFPHNALYNHACTRGQLKSYRPNPLAQIHILICREIFSTSFYTHLYTFSQSRVHTRTHIHYVAGTKFLSQSTHSRHYICIPLTFSYTQGKVGANIHGHRNIHTEMYNI